MERVPLSRSRSGVEKTWETRPMATCRLKGEFGPEAVTIPALSSRKMETNIELGEGQSFVIAGLIDRQVTETPSKIPVLSSLPILGNLFKSKEFDRNESELIVMVTPEITMPLEPGDAKPSPAMPRPFLVPVTPGSSDAFPAKSKTK